LICVSIMEFPRVAFFSSRQRRLVRKKRRI
jgi:hypothetical protein